MRSSAFGLPTDGSQDDLISCLKEGKRGEGVAVFLKIQTLLQDGETDRKPFEILEMIIMQLLLSVL